jgi:hypothetical protein
MLRVGHNIVEAIALLFAAGGLFFQRLSLAEPFLQRIPRLTERIVTVIATVRVKPSLEKVSFAIGG